MRAGAATMFTAAELEPLRAQSDWRGVALVAHAWGTIAGAMALAAAIPHPAMYALCIMIIGGRQLGLAILMHDAAHRALAKSPWLNDALGQWFCAWPVAADLHGYRSYHLQHHRRTQQPDDPDLSLSAPFPISRRSLARKIIRDLTGQTTFKQRSAQLRAALGKPEWPLSQRLSQFRQRLGGPLAVNAVLLVACTAAGRPDIYVLLWVVPFFTWLPLITRLRNIAEHAVVPDNDDPLRNARTTHANWFMRAVLAPYWVNYHVEHHLYMWVPCHQLPRLHRMLLDKGLGPKMEFQPDYLTVLKMATSGGRRALPPLPANDTTEALSFNSSLRVGEART
ncbi:MAG TPA: fatty acid desaturase [Alphaproteobacteria bacterium]|nr:fatty acid desaturase [Alphaproteobacteria bacterium]